MHAYTHLVTREPDRISGRRRRPPSLRSAWWNHQRHVAVRLYRAIEKTIGQNTLAQAGQRVLDLGCGDRPYEGLLRSHGFEYVAADLDGDVNIQVESGIPVPLDDNSMDGVLSSQVLEHVWDLGWYLGECRRVLKPGGWLLLSTHGAWLYHPHPTDFRRWTRDGLTRELSTSGFQVVAVEPVVGPLAWTTQFRLLGLRHLLLKLPLLGTLLLIPLTCVMNLRMALEDAITPASIRRDNACIYVTFARKPES